MRSWVINAVSALGLSALAISASGVRAADAPAAAGTLAPEARAALEGMSAYLRGLKSFEVIGEGSSETALDSGQKIEFGVGLRYLVSQPGKLVAEFSIGARQRQMFYDGATLTIAAPDKNYYAQVPMTGSLRSLLDKASVNYDLELPLAGLFRWSDPSRPLEMPTSGLKVGTAKCGTAVCNQFAFRQQGFDWQIWIPQTGVPLPMRFVVNGRIGKAPPHTAMNLTWKTDAPVTPDRFAFVVPAGATRIPIKSAEQPAGGK